MVGISGSGRKLDDYRGTLDRAPHDARGPGGGVAAALVLFGGRPVLMAAMESYTRYTVTTMGGWRC